MDIVLIGAGRVATNLADTLVKAHHHIIYVMSRTVVSAHSLAEKLHCPASTDVNELPDDADLYLVAVTDGAVQDIVRELGKRVKSGIVAHTAGSIPLEVFKDSGLKNYGVFYPMQTFSKERSADFHRVSCFIEANNADTTGKLKELGESIGSKVYELSSEERRYLHLAAVFACNFSNHCYTMAEQILKPHGIPFEVLLPLIDETVRKIHVLSPETAQTGPAVRNDVKVMNAQKELLAALPDRQKIYELMSQDIQKQSEAQ